MVAGGQSLAEPASPGNIMAAQYAKTGAASDANITETLVPFPPGCPRPHETARWARSLESVATAKGLTCVPLNRLPKGKFPPMWSDAALEPC